MSSRRTIGPRPHPPQVEAASAAFRPELDAAYREGYFDAARHLAGRVRNEHLDRWLMFPAIYCYRHAIELSLKSLIRRYSGLVAQMVECNLESEHGLMQLWHEAQRHLAMVYTAGKEDTDRNVERCLKELHDVDRNSQLFRYPTNKSGASVEALLPRIDVGQLVRTMDNLRAFLEACEAQADYLIECHEQAWEALAPEPRCEW